MKLLIAVVLSLSQSIALAGTNKKDFVSNGPGRICGRNHQVTPTFPRLRINIKGVGQPAMVGF